MHPAPSVIFFTVMSGFGYGLAFILSLNVLDPTTLAADIAWFVALAAITAGLLSSTLHLGNPQRAWRAFSQWRSSWLSREGIASILTYVPLTISAAMVIFLDRNPGLLGFLGALGCAVTVYCTSMIYASLRTIRAWSSPLTPACYVLFSLSSGALAAVFFARLAGQGAGGLIVLALVSLALAGIAKAAWTFRMKQPDLATNAGTATGLGYLGTVHLLERPHAMENYLTKEMVYRVGRKHADKLRVLALALAIVLPAICIALIALGAPAVPLAAVATACHLGGLLAERWLFFAEARHVVANYYGA